MLQDRSKEQESGEWALRIIHWPHAMRQRPRPSEEAARCQEKSVLRIVVWRQAMRQHRLLQDRRSRMERRQAPKGLLALRVCCYHQGSCKRQPPQRGRIEEQGRRDGC